MIALFFIVPLIFDWFLSLFFELDYIRLEIDLYINSFYYCTRTKKVPREVPIMIRYCRCGRRIIVRLENGKKGRKWARPKDKNHKLCQKCYVALLDSMRNRMEVNNVA